MNIYPNSLIFTTDMTTVAYPASLLKFSSIIAKILQNEPKSKLMLVYPEIIKECVAFYDSICPTDTAKAKISYENIGRTLVEKFPNLSSPSEDGKSEIWQFLRASCLKECKMHRIKRKWQDSSLNTNIKRKTVEIAEIKSKVITVEEHQQNQTENGEKISIA
jgi:hypothetical protein